MIPAAYANFFFGWLEMLFAREDDEASVK